MNFIFILSIFLGVTVVQGGERGEKEPIDCLKQCTNDLIEDLKIRVGEDFITTVLRIEVVDILWKAFSVPEKFTIFCDRFYEMAQCTQKCPISFLGELLKQAGKIVEYNCVTRFQDILTYLPCLRTMKEDKECVKPCHDNFFDSMKKLTRQFAHLMLLGDTENIEEVFSGYCSYISCHYDCKFPRTISKCGQITSDLIVDITTHTFGILRNVALGTGVVGHWPEPCEMLANYTTPSTTAATTVMPTTTMGTSESPNKSTTVMVRPETIPSSTELITKKTPDNSVLTLKNNWLVVHGLLTLTLFLIL